MKLNKNKFFLSLLLGLAILGGVLTFLFPMNGGGGRPLFSFSGNTMGTTYEVKIVGGSLNEILLQELKGKVEAELLAVNEAMSTYMPGSEISRFNRLQAGVWMPIGERFREVMERSTQIFRLTGGAFDPTLGPLIDLWGFGAEGGRDAMPEPEQIAAAMAETGFEQLELTEEGLRKHSADLEVNLSAIAKGYGVDRVAALLRAEGHKNIYVEIGGEVVCAGVNARGIPWRIGIQAPGLGAAESAMQVLGLNNAALATSGDYRNFSVSEAGFRHHILDPRTGYPARHALASVSVIAEDCMTADAVATALFVMGTEEGLRWVEKQEDLEALFVDRVGEEFKITATEGFRSTLIAVP